MFKALSADVDDQRRLLEELWETTLRASSVLGIHGVDSPEFAAADEVARVPAKQLAENIQRMASNRWIASGWDEPYH